MRTIRVKGTGKVAAKVDLVVIEFYLEAKQKEYESAMRMASKQIDAVRDALAAIGYARDDLKTSDFNVYTYNESVREKNGSYKSVFGGYTCRHSLTLKFDFDNRKLAQTLSAIAGSTADPNLSVRFTVKDRDSVNNELLRSAAQNARENAEVLCEASGVQLGELVSIDYSWGELNLISETRYSGYDSMICSESESFTADIDPEDVHASDTATFVWEIR